MPGVVVDTHAALWYLLDAARLSTAAGDALDQAVRAGLPIYLPSICLVEMRFLAERGRLSEVGLQRLHHAVNDVPTVLRIAALDYAVARAGARIPRDQVPEMPDRIIAATALHLDVPLVTRDHAIRAAPIETIW
jgi:PIN domain nuclease of toxin-antitoxin system